MANRIVEGLQREFLGRLRLEIYLWELDAMRAHADYQSQIPATSEFDIVVCIFWTRLGKALAPDASGKDAAPLTGTQFELETALAAARAGGKPDILLYKKTLPPTNEERDPREALRKAQERIALEEYWTRLVGGGENHFWGASTKFETSDEFATRFEAHVRKLLLELDPENKPKAYWTGCPYRGLDSFEAEHTTVFYGRRSGSLEVAELLCEQAARGTSFVLVSGASGTGKSSLARAGVRPLLTSPGFVPGINEWRVAIYRPSDAGHDLARGIAEALAAPGALPELLRANRSIDALADEMRRSPASLEPEVRNALLSIADSRRGSAGLEPSRSGLFLIVDQLEEILDTKAAAHRDAFGTALEALCSGRLARVWVLATVRSDLLHKLQEHPVLRSLCTTQGSYVLQAPTPGELREIIRQPAIAAGARFEERSGKSLDEAILEDALSYPNLLPLLQFTLQELWRRDVEPSESAAPSSQPPLLRFDTYKSLAGEQAEAQAPPSPIISALTAHADRLFAELAREHPVAHAELDRLLERLVRVGPKATVRVPLAHEALESMGPDAVLLSQAMVQGRLLTPYEGSIELAHEALTLHWRHLTELVERRRHHLASLARVEAAAVEWDRARRGTEERYQDRLLAAGLPLEEGRSVLREMDGSSDPLTAEFVQASIAAEDRRQEQAARAREALEAERAALQRRRLRAAQRFGLVAAALCLIALGSYWKALREQDRAALEHRRRTLTLANVERDPLSRRRYLAELPEEFEDPGLVRVLLEASAEAVPRSELRHSAGRARQVAVRPSGGLLAAAWSDGVWCLVEIDARGRIASDPQWQRSSLASLDGSLEWAPDGERLWLELHDHSTEAWNIDEAGTAELGERLAQPVARSGAEDEDAAFRRWSPDRRYLVRVALSGAPAVWDRAAQTWFEPFEAAGAQDDGGRGRVEAAEFDPTGEWLALATLDGTLHWGPSNGSEAWDQVDLRSNGSAAKLAEQVDPTDWTWTAGNPTWIAHEAAFPTQIVAASPGSSRALKPLSLPFGDDGGEHLLCIAADRAQRTLVAGADDGSVQVWGLEELALRARFPAHEGDVEDVAVDPDGRWWVSAGSDGRIRIWSCTPRENPTASVHRPGPASPAELTSVLAFSPDGGWLVEGSWIGASRLWRVQTRDEVPVLTLVEGFHPERLRRVQFSANGDWLAALSEGGELGLWLISDRAPSRVALPALPPQGATALGFAPGSDVLLAGTAGGLYACSLDRAAGTAAMSWARVPLDLPESAALSGWCISPGALGVRDEQGTLTLFRRESERWIPARTLVQTSDGTAVRFDALGRSALVVGPGRAPVVLDLARDTSPATPLGDSGVVTWNPGTGYFECEPMAALSGDGRWAAFACEDGSIAWWDLKGPDGPELRSGDPAREATQGAHRHETRVRALGFDPSGAWLASTDGSGRTLLWNCAGRHEPSVFDHGRPTPVQTAFSPAEPWLAIASPAGGLQIWNRDPEWARQRLRASLEAYREAFPPVTESKP